MEDAGKPFDIVIIGGGLVGASLCVALQPANQKVLLIESINPESDTQPSFDERTVALTHSARLIYGAMGAWEEISSRQAEPILDIHISNQGHFGQTCLSHKDAGTDALGYVVPTRVLGQVLWKQIEQDKNTTIACPASATGFEQIEDYCQVNLCEEGKVSQVKSKLVVLADGGRSEIGKQLAAKQIKTEYPQSAILSIITTDRAHHGRAYERFTAEGPLALLPHSTITEDRQKRARFALVWSTSQKYLETRLSMTDDDFIASLQTAFGDRAGYFTETSPRKCYPLKRTLLTGTTANRIIVMGNAAHTVHPVAGQGFNLGLRDVATLAELIYSDNQGDLSDPGNSALIEKYRHSRKHDTEMVHRFTHSLIQIFSNDNRLTGLVRNLGLNAIGHFPPAKRFLLKRTMGLAGNQCKMALGIPLCR